MQDADPKLETQIQLERLYSKNQLIPRLRAYYQEELKPQIDLAAFFEQAEIDEDFGFSLVVQIALHRRTTLPTMVGIMRRHFDDAQDVADHILKCCEVDLLHWNPAFSQLVVEPALTIPEHVQRELDLFQFPLPMVVEPREITSNRDTGYVTQRGSVILRGNHHGDDVCLEHLNRVNRIPMAVNQDTATMIANSWRNLDKQKEGESREDFEKRKRSFEKFDRTCHMVIDVMVENDNHFYLTHKYDKRGRVYCQGYHLNTQGNTWSKAILELAEKEIVQL